MDNAVSIFFEATATIMKNLIFWEVKKMPKTNLKVHFFSTVCAQDEGCSHTDSVPPLLASNPQSSARPTTLSEHTMPLLQHPATH